ncbi:hypothetical protein CB1_000849005 [Camelus ferus]|nr:hypothetical protein CB1_000849005 [Camelus ferus]
MPAGPLDAPGPTPPRDTLRRTLPSGLTASPSPPLLLQPCCFQNGNISKTSLSGAPSRLAVVLTTGCNGGDGSILSGAVGCLQLNVIFTFIVAVKESNHISVKNGKCEYSFDLLIDLTRNSRRCGQGGTADSGDTLCTASLLLRPRHSPSDRRCQPTTAWAQSSRRQQGRLQSCTAFHSFHREKMLMMPVLTACFHLQAGTVAEGRAAVRETLGAGLWAGKDSVRALFG